MNPPSEFAEQAALLVCVRRYQARYPLLGNLIHIPNGEKRDPATAGKLKAMGLQAGVPDLFLPVTGELVTDTGFDRYPGLWIEMKARSGRATATQMDWHKRLLSQGYAVRVCRSWHEAWRTICEYLAIPYEVQ